MAAVSVTNDLQTPIEVKLRSGEWQVVYPQKSWHVEVSSVNVEIRLLEKPALKSSCKVTDGSSELWASVDFETFSREAKGRDRAEARELAREGKRREEAQMRTDQMIKEAAVQKRDARAFKGLWRVVAYNLTPPLVLLIVCVAIPPGSALAAALLASATVPLCCCLSPMIASGCQPRKRSDDYYLGGYAVWLRFSYRLLGFLALALLLLMTVQHAQQGFSWTAAIIWPVPVFCGGGFLVSFWKMYDPDRDAALKMGALVAENEEARREVSNRTIRFDGSVIRERGRPCVASWPGKYAGAWESLVSQGRNNQVSAAVVFLPQGTDDYGKCDSIPPAEGLPGTCWCTPLYGEQKPWGCRWFTKWRENIETAVQSGAELEVYYFQNRVGKGKVKSFYTAGHDNLQREDINRKQKDFEESREFEQALDAGLRNLSKEPRGDGSSQYSREARRLFLASLSETEREFLATSEGLGNSQKAEVAWLEKKGYTYWEVDVSTWLPGEGVERYVPLSDERQPQLYGRQDDFSPVSISIARE